MLRCEAPVRRPADLAELVAMRAEDPAATIVAGGTDIMVYLEGGALRPTAIIDAWHCRGLRWIADDGLSLGATTTFAELTRHPAVPAVLKEVALTIGAQQIQERATIGGNIVNSSPAGDSLPAWLALDADFELASVRGTRRVPAAQFWLGYKSTAMQPDEVLSAVYLPPVRGAVCFRKVGTRTAQSISKVVLCGRYLAGAEARIALGSVAATPLRLAAAEAALVSGGPRPEVARIARDAVRPIDDVRSTAAYRSAVVANIIEHWMETLAAAPR